jgi:hypothetical protein
MSSPRISYIPHPDVTPEAERSALVNVFKFVLARDCAKDGGRPSAKSDCDDATLVRAAEGVNHVEQRPD